MAQILEPGLFTRVFTSTAGLGDIMTEGLLEDLADASVDRARELLLTYRAPVTGPSTSPYGEPPALRSGNLRASIGHDDARPEDYGTASVLIGPREGFRTPYGTGQEAYRYGGYLEHEQGHPFLKRSVREASEKLRAGGWRFTQWMGRVGGHGWGFFS